MKSKTSARDVQKKLGAVIEKQKEKNLDVKFELAGQRRQIRALSKALFRVRMMVRELQQGGAK